MKNFNLKSGDKKMKKIIIIFALVLTFANGIAWAGHGAFYTDTGDGNYVYTLSKFTGNCPSGNVLQSIGQIGSSSVAPTNIFPYLGPGETLSLSPYSLAPCMGTDPLYYYYYGDGVFGTMVDVPDTHLHGYVRAFSSMTIAGSAYYGNSPCVAINPKTGSVSDNMISSSFSVDTVNPAYIIPWSVIPFTNSPSCSIDGTIDTAVSDNNKLTAADVKVQVRVKPSGEWEDHPLPYIPGFAGNFQVRAISTSGNFPVSAVYDVDGVCPEPAFFGFLALVALAFFRRK